MKKTIVWVLLLALLLGAFTGCKKTEDTTPTFQEEAATVMDAVAYLKAIYVDEGAKTPVDYERFSVVRIAGIPFEVVWTVNVGEELIKIVPGDNGMTTIDINEQCAEDTPYVLTATVTNERGESDSHSWNYILPKAVDMVSIVNEAYALKKGASLPYEATLIGKITAIDSVYDPEFKNISVVIAVEGAEDKPILCYRLKGEGADKLAVGNIITVTGTLTNYNGTIEFTSGCSLDAVEKGDAVDAPTDVGKILKAAYKLKDGKSLPYPVTLTGVVTEVDTPYDPGYKNISVVIKVDGYSRYPILCYRLKGNDVDKIAVKDTITVTGIIKNYKGTIEFDSGCRMTERVSGGGVAQKPSSNQTKILKDAKKLKPGESLPYYATLTGEVISVDDAYSSQYKNVTVTMLVDGTKIQCYRMKGDNASKVRATDKITVTGVIENFYGKLEFGSGCTLDKWVKGDRIVEINYGPLKEDTAYMMEMKQVNLGKLLYFSGKMDGQYLATSESSNNAVKVYMEKVSGKGVRFFFENAAGKKVYLEIAKNSEEKVRPLLSEKATVYWTYDKDAKVYTVDVGGTKYYYGTYNTFDTISCSSTWYITDSNAANKGKTQFVAEYVTKTSDPLDPPEIATPTGETLTIEQAIAKGAAKEHNTYTTEKYFVSGEITEVYQTTYGNMKIKDNKGNILTIYGTYSADGTKRYDAMDVKPVAGDTVTVWGIIGQYNDVPQMKNAWITAHTPVGGSGGEGGGNEQPNPPAADYVTAPVAETGYHLAVNKSGTKLYITGATGSSAWYLATSENVADAKEVKLEAVTGGYRLYFMDGNTKTYIRISERDAANGKGTLELTTTAPAEVLTYDATVNTLVLNCASGNSYYLGTYSTYTTLNVSNTSYITGSNAANVDVSQFPARFYAISGGSTGGEGGEGGGNEQPNPPAVDYVTAPVAETGYYLAANKSGTKMYITGATGSSTWYLATTENVAEAKEVKLEAVSGGYRLYFMDGNTKTYIRISERDAANGKGTLELTTTAPAEVMVYDATANTLVLNCASGHSYYLGTYAASTYTTLQVSNTSYITGDNAAKVDVEQFPVHFYAISGGSTGGEGGSTGGEGGSTTVDYVTAPVAETGYHLAANKSGTKMYITGATGSSTWYLATTENVAEAKEVKLEAVTGGYRLYFMDGNTKTYIRISERDAANGKGTLELTTTAPAEVMVYDAAANTLVVNCASGHSYYLGTYAASTYTTLQVSNTSYITGDNAAKVDVEQFPVHFYAISGGSTGGEGGSTGGSTTNPPAGDYVKTPVAGTGYHLAANKSGTKMYITGATGSSTWYLATTENVAEAKEVKLEAVTGGYRLYFMDGNTKTYIRISERDAANGKGTLELTTTAPAEVMVYDATANTLVLNCASGHSYYLGTYAASTYTTLQVSNTSYITGDNAAKVDVEQFPVHFYAITGGSTGGNTGTGSGSSTAVAAATISFADTANRTVFSTTQQVWTQNGITVTNNKGSATSNVADYSNPARFYKSSDLTVAYTGMTKLVVKCSYVDYAGFLETVASAHSAVKSVSVSGTTVTIEFTGAVNEFTVSLTAGKVFVNSMDVYTN